MSDWKQAHANEAKAALDTKLVQDVISEQLGNLGYPPNSRGLPWYGLHKIAMYAASVARAQALGFDPDLLRLSDEEADEHLLALAKQAVATGKPVWVLDLSSGSDRDE